MEQFKNFHIKKVETVHSKLGTLKVLFLYCAEFYDCSGSSVVENFAFGRLRKESIILTYRFIKDCDSNTAHKNNFC